MIKGASKSTSSVGKWLGQRGSDFVSNVKNEGKAIKNVAKKVGTAMKDAAYGRAKQGTMQTISQYDPKTGKSSPAKKLSAPKKRSFRGVQY
jgi:hypothetical protein